jgi:hypothetical protein
MLMFGGALALAPSPARYHGKRGSGMNALTSTENGLHACEGKIRVAEIGKLQYNGNLATQPARCC